jgi:hypothetical protein
MILGKSSNDTEATLLSPSTSRSIEEVRAFYEASYAHFDEVGEEEQDADCQLPMDLASVWAMEGSRTGTASRFVSEIYQYLQSPVVKCVDPLSYRES